MARFRNLDPLSALTYYRRRKRRALPFVVTIALSVFGIATIIAFSNSLSDTMMANYKSLTQLSIVIPWPERALDPNTMSELKSNPQIAAIYPEKGFSISMDLIAGGGSFRLYGLSKDGITAVMARFGTRVVEGRMLKSGTNEFVLSVEIARAYGLRIGDKIGGADDRRNWLPTEFVLVGLLEGDARMGFVSYEYLNEHEAWRERTTNYLVIAREHHKAKLDQFLEDLASKGTVRITSYNVLLESMRRNSHNLFLVLGFLNVVIIVIITVAMGMLNQIYMMQRMGEYGLLHAIGYSRGRLAIKAVLEVWALAILGWAAGTLLSTVFLAWLGSTVFAARGLILHVFSPNSLMFTIPIAIAIPLLNAPIILATLSRFDPVAIIERRE